MIVIDSNCHLDEAHHPTSHMTISDTPVVVTYWLSLVVKSIVGVSEGSVFQYINLILFKIGIQS